MDQFQKHVSIKPDGIRAKCNVCRSQYRRKASAKNPEACRKQRNSWAAKNREKVRVMAREYRKKEHTRFKSYSLKKDFGIDINEFNRLMDLQKGLCKLCGEPEKTYHQSGRLKALAVDHCHKTGKIRGLLCWVCNTGIGKLKDSPELLRKAAAYIEEAS